jgi:hypothetical protein
MKSFRELRDWQAAMILVEQVYMLTHEFPVRHQFAGQTDVRAAKCVSASIEIGAGT